MSEPRFLLKPVEVTGLVPLLQQAGINLREWGPCDCHGSNDCPHCGGSNTRERIIRVYQIDRDATIDDCREHFGSKYVAVRFRAHKGLRYAVIVED